MRALATLLVACLTAAALGGCDRADMVSQPKADTWDRSAVFANGASMRPPVEGTVPRDEPNRPVVQPAVITAALVARGQNRYDIVCTPCHGRTGEGNGMVVQRGFPPPPSLMDDGLVKASAAFLDDVIANGHGAMYGYAALVPPADRWAIVAYIRALQASHAVPVAALDEADRVALASSPGKGQP